MQKLGEIASVKGGKRLPKGESLTTEPNSHPYIRTKDIENHVIKIDQLEYVPDAVQKKISRYTVDAGDLVVSIVGTVGSCAIVPAELHRANLTENCAKILLNTEDYTTHFLYYFLRSPQGQQEIFKNTVGSTQLKLPLYGIENIDLPSLNVTNQKAIAHILGTLDDKIELNQKMNQTLEEIAKAIFKSWFVDFDPVRAKAEGRPTGLPPEISDLFPDELVDSEIGEIPKGWDIQPAESLFDITIGRTPPRKESQWFSELATDVPWVSIKDMGDCGTFISKTSEYLTRDAVSKYRMHKLPVGSVLVSFKLTVGRVAITTENMTTNEAIAHFPPSDAFPYPNFAYFYLKGFGYESLGSTSSIATAVNSKMIKAIPFIVATSDLTAQFEEIVAPMMDRIRVASEETHVLSELRDTLLPKLISGELRIPDAEKFLEDAGI